MNNEKNLHLPNAGIYVTLQCNLRCKMCATYSPYYDKPYNPTLEQHLREIDRVFELVDSVDKFIICGGEPLIRKDLHLVIKHLLQYVHRIDLVKLITNGTIVPNDNILYEAKLFGGKFEILVDNYGSDISKKAVEVTKVVQAYGGIPVELRDYYSENMFSGGWVNYLDFELNRTEDEAKYVFSKCAFPQKFGLSGTVKDGIIYPCQQLRRCIELGKVVPNDDEVINIYDETITDEQIREKIAKLNNIDVLSACKYCNGLCDDSVRYKPAEQLIIREDHI